MSEAISYAPGTPIWADLVSSDLDASKAFYGGLFGWEAQVTPDPEAGGYTMFLLNGKVVAGLGPLFHPAQPPAWSVYVCTADAAATAETAREAGGQVVMGPMQVLDAGTLALVVDPTGAAIGLWQPGQHTGAQVFNSPGAMCWNELNTRDVEAARSFYGAVFGWKSETNVIGNGGGTYTEWKMDGRSIAGAYEMGKEIPADVPPHWLTYFAVEDCDASVKRAQELGGSVTVPAMDIPEGRFSVLRDLQGATFAVIALRG